MKLSLNNITYGNPTQRHRELMLNKCLVDDLFTQLKDFPFPENDSDSTKQELNELVDFIKDIQIDDNEKFKKRYVFYDKNLYQAILNSFKTEKADLEQLIKDIDEDITPLIIRLKYFYQRPRPYQLANYYKLKLFPFKSATAHSPSYPSGHTIQTYVMLTVIGNILPEFYEKSKKMIEDVANSRCYIGVHYPTDNDFAYQVAQEILKHPDFAKKYGI